MVLMLSIFPPPSKGEELNKSSRILGLLVKVKKNYQTSKAIKILSQKLGDKGYQFEKQYEKFNVLVFSFENSFPKKNPENDCELLKTFEFVQACSPNQVLELNEEQIEVESPCPNSELIKLDPELVAVSNIEKCQLTPSLASSLLPGKPAFPPGLSMYWAQEYTGADIVRKKLELIKDELNIPSNFVDIIDSDSHPDFVDHGLHCSNLIGGPNPVGIVPMENAVELDINANEHVNVIDQLSLFLEKDPPPRYINWSMATFGSEVIAQSFEEMVDQTSSVVIKGCGNGNKLSEDLPYRDLSHRDKVILVGSLSPSGEPSEFSSYGEELTISAPSDHFLISTNREGMPEQFGGTSGAAPQVASALAAFELLAGYPLSVAESKRLLEKTALPNVNLPVPNAYGHGSLNAAFMAEIAKRLNDVCQQDKTCMENNLAEDQIYERDNDISILDSLGDYFPSCNDEKLENLSVKSCAEKKEYFNNLREKAFISSSPELWDAISCISKEDGFEQNGQYYHRLAERFKHSEEYYLGSLVGKEYIKHILGLRHYRGVASSRYKEGFEAALSSSRHRNFLLPYLSVTGLFSQNEKFRLIDREIEKNKYISTKYISSVCLRGEPSFEKRLVEIINGKRNDPFMENHYIIKGWGESLIGHPCWKGSPLVDDIIEKILNGPSGEGDYSKLIFFMKQTPHVKSNPKFATWVKKLLDMKKFDSVILEHLISSEDFIKRDDFHDFLEIYLSRGHDSLVIEHLMSKKFFSTSSSYQKLFDKFIKSDKNHEKIIENIFTPGIYGDDKELISKNLYQQYVSLLFQYDENKNHLINSRAITHPFFMDHPDYIMMSKKMLASSESFEKIGLLFRNPYWVKNEPDVIKKYIEKNKTSQYFLSGLRYTASLYESNPNLIRDIVSQVDPEKDVKLWLDTLLTRQVLTEAPTFVIEFLKQKKLNKDNLIEVLTKANYLGDSKIIEFLEQNPELDPRN